MIYRLDQQIPKFNETNFIAPDASVIGNVELKENASIWFGAVIRGDNDPIIVGENSNIQDGSILHTDLGAPLTIESGVTIGHKVMLHGCMIQADTLIGINSTILNHAVIGRNSMVGANSLITEGKEFPENSLIMGSPAKVVRELNAEEVMMIKFSAKHYVENAKRFQKGLTAF
ncbi:MAG: gamma carbonic anhydrase family protein [Gammaproteobacteria bacterium]|nr:gamma carbonic anhydrase family protein [Gammaproteobacteria bacterium]MDP6146707.1 gamma carbonic anhydrase family protein [Gammaproteobacteria bacterium]HJM08654.1 gamma carbonic anhydrase family protein [Gammaproteobacteria bacterium]HJN00653.1 gamma carbonic anhydrase family protein [Gammaproteobacteria bacterium]